MKSWEKLSETIFRFFTSSYMQTFEDSSPEKILKRSLKVLDLSALNSLKQYVKNNLTESGGFVDRAGRPDLYYTLFGFFLADALELNELFPYITGFVEKELRQNKIEGVHLHCAAILSAKLGNDKTYLRKYYKSIRLPPGNQLNRQPAYSAFLSLLTCYYMRDYMGLYIIKRHIKGLGNFAQLPSPVIAALLVLQRSFKKPVKDLSESLLSFYHNNGGFKATLKAPVPDLLSTAVALYALQFAGSDLRMIKPDCLDYIDSMFGEGGFGGNAVDQDPDIEYTFYGLLALGALAE